MYIICDSNLKLHSLKTLEFLINDGHKVYFYSNKLYFKRLLKFTIEKKGLTIISFIPFLYLLTVLLKRIRIKSGLIDNYLLKGLYLKLKKQLEMIESEYIFISFDYLFMANDVKKNGQAISIIDIRTTLNERSLASNPKLRVLAKNLGYYDIALVPSRIAYDGLKNYFTESRIKILPYGYETNYNPVSKSKRVPLRALFVGRPSNEKGIELIIKLSNFFSNDLLEITVVGGYVGIDRKIPIKFKQMGYLSKSELEHEYINNDVLLAPTRLEGMSYAILEALAFGLVVITTKNSGYCEIIDSGSNGFILNEELENWISVINGLIIGDNNIDFISNNALNLAKKFKWRDYYDRLESIIITHNT